MSRMQLNSKFVNNMLLEWGRFVTAVKLNRGLRGSNYDQLYAYLKQHETHAKENKMMLERFSEHTVDPLTLMNQATVQDGKVVVQNVQGRQNKGYGMNPRGGGAAGYGGVQNRVGNANPGQARHVKCYNFNGTGHIARNCTQPKLPQNSKYYKDKMLLMQAQENGAALNAEQLLFLVGGQDNAIDDDVDEQPVQDLALNMDNVFQADDRDAFDYDVDKAPTAQTMFMANLSSADLITDKAGPSYDSNILSEVQDYDHYQDVVCAHHEEHAMHDNVQLNHVVDSHADYTSDSNMIPYDQYIKDNAVPVVHSNVSSVPNDAYMMIYNDIPKPYYNELNKVAIGYKNPLCLTRAKQVQPALYNGHEIIKDNHVLAIMYNTEDTLEIAEITRRKMNDKMKDPECVTHKSWKLRLPKILLIGNMIRLNRKTFLLQMNNLIAECLSKEVFTVATNSELNVVRFTEMHVANTIVEAHCLELEAELSNLRDKSHHDNHEELVNRFSKLEVTTLTTENVNLKAQMLDKVNSISKDHVKPKVLAPRKYAIDVEPIVPRIRNNREAHLDYLRHLKKSVETIRDIVEEAKIVVQIVLWYLDSYCSKHMTGDRSRLMNFVKKFIGTVRFGNDHFGAIMGYGDYVIGDSVISKVYYVEGLGHNLFFVGQFCDSDLEVAFRKNSYYVRDTDSVELIKGSRGSNLYTISIEDIMKSSSICLLSKALKNKSWLWHRRFNHLNFGTINDLARKDLVRGLPRLKFKKDHLCSACQLGKSKKHTHKSKTENTNLEVLNTLHIDLCDLMRVQTINGKKYILVIVDDYSRFTWVKFLRSKDETLEKLWLQPTADIGIFVGYAPSMKAGTPSSTTIDQDAPSLSIPSSSSALQSHQGVVAEPTFTGNNLVAPVDNNPFINVFALEPSSD
nr:retrovirus-related Pol polyprotein from transposon TNT 1-94 [Tanacetum cinerariifolium]